MDAATDTTMLLLHSVQLALGFVFLTAAISKLRQPARFVEAIAAYNILPRRLAPSVALVAILSELSLALAFAADWHVRIALPLAAVLLLLFFGAVGINLKRGRLVPCGCFGGSAEIISVRTTVRLFLLLSAVALLLMTTQQRERHPAAFGVVDFSHRIDVAYLVEVLALAAFLILAGLWALNLREVVSVVLGSRRGEVPNESGGSERLAAG